MYLEQYEVFECLIRANNDACVPLLTPLLWIRVARLSRTIHTYMGWLRPDVYAPRLHWVPFSDARLAAASRLLTIREVQLRDARLDRVVWPCRPFQPAIWLRGLRALQLWDLRRSPGAWCVAQLALLCPHVTTLTLVDLHDREVDARPWPRLHSLDLCPRRGETKSEYFGSSTAVFLPRQLRALSIRTEQRVAEDDDETREGLSGLLSLTIRHPRGVYIQHSSIIYAPPPALWVSRCRTLQKLYERNRSPPDLAGSLIKAGCQLRTLRVHVPSPWLRQAAGDKLLLANLGKLLLVWRKMPRSRVPSWEREWAQIVGAVCDRAARLRVLHLHCTRFTDGDGPVTLDFVAQSASLEVLRASGLRRLQDLRALSTCFALRELHLHHAMALTDLAPLGACASLEELHLTCGATCLEPLARCPKLCTLRLSGCLYISDVSPLHICVPLRRLTLRGCLALRDLLPLVGSGLEALHVLHCPLVRGPPLARVLRALQTTIRSVRILCGDHVVHHTKLVANQQPRYLVHYRYHTPMFESPWMARWLAARPQPVVRYLPAPRHSLAFEATVAVTTDIRAVDDVQRELAWQGGNQLGVNALSRPALAHVQRVFETAGCSPCWLVHCGLVHPTTPQKAYIFAFADPTHAEQAARQFARLRLPVEDGHAIVRLARGRWRRRRCRLLHEEGW